MSMVTPDALMPLSVALCHADWRSGIQSGTRLPSALLCNKKRGEAQNSSRELVSFKM